MANRTITSGTVVMDVFHTKFLLTRSREGWDGSSGLERMAKVQAYQGEVDRDPHRIELRDALAAELLGLSARLYEDAREAHANGFPDHVADKALDLSHDMSMRALDELDVMATLFLGAQSAPRRVALRAGVGYNQTVGLLEFGHKDDARGHVAALRREIGEVSASSDPTLTSIAGFVRDLEGYFW